jgi:MFS family permease
MLWAPLSEVYGRKIAVLPPYFLSAIFAFATATAKDVQTIFITRFFAGFFGSAPVTITSGVLADLWAPQQRGKAMLAYALTIIGGPLVAPVVGGAIVHSNLGWRWTEYVSTLTLLRALDYRPLTSSTDYWHPPISNLRLRHPPH